MSDTSLVSVQCTVALTSDSSVYVRGLTMSWYLLRYHMAGAHVELFLTSRIDGLALQSFFAETYGVLPSLYRLSEDGNSFELEV